MLVTLAPVLGRPLSTPSRPTVRVLSVRFMYIVKIIRLVRFRARLSTRRDPLVVVALPLHVGHVLAIGEDVLPDHADGGSR